MRPSFLLPALTVLILSSCSTSYKTGQTPDDLYFSPARPEEDYRQKEEDKKEEKQDQSTSYQQSDDNYLRLKTRNRYRWSELDDDTYYYNRRYSYSSGYCNCTCFGTPWIPSYYWNNYFNPYHQPYIITDPKKAAVYNAPRHFNLNAYTGNTAGTTGNTKTDNSSGNISKYAGNNSTEPRNKPARNESNAGNILRDIFRGGNSGSSGSNNSNNSSSSSSSGSSGSSSGSSGSSAPVRKF